MAAHKRTLVNLQICRAIAATIVVIGHTLQDANTIAARADVAGLHSDLAWGFGVDLFFVISGFIMVYISGNDFGRPGASWHFYSRRLARIVPPYWLLTTALILGAMVLPQLLNVPIGGVGHIVKSYLFIPDWRSDHSAMRPVMALGWTLNYEMFFYALFAIVLFFPFNRGIAILAIIFAALVTAHFTIVRPPGVLAFWTDPILLEFLLGVLLALIFRAGLRLSALASCALVLIGLAAMSPIPGSQNLDPNFNLLRFGVPAAMVIAAATLGPALPSTALTRFGVRLGDASYALYLVHPFVIRPLRNIWLHLGLAKFPLELYCVICVAAAVIVAFALHYLFERPVTDFLHKWLDDASDRSSNDPAKAEARQDRYRKPWLSP